MIHLPPEVIRMIANECGQELFALTLTSRTLYGICNRLLYRNNAEYLGSFVIFKSMLSNEREDRILNRLEYAKAAGVDFKKWTKTPYPCPTETNGGARTATLLHTAAYLGFGSILRFLITVGFDINADIDIDTGKDSQVVSEIEPKTPLHLAILSLQEGTANILIEKNASLFFCKTNALNMAAKSSLPTLIKILVNIHGMDINATDSIGYTPLIWAIISSTRMNKGLVPLVIKLGADINKRSSNGMSPLMIACSMKKYQLALDLLDAGARIFYPISGINSQKLQQKAQDARDEKQRFAIKALIAMDSSRGYPSFSRHLLDVYCIDNLIEGLFLRDEDLEFVSFLFSANLAVLSSIWGGIERCVKMVSIGEIEWARTTYPPFLQVLHAAFPFISERQREDIPEALMEFMDDMNARGISFTGRSVWTELSVKFPEVKLPFIGDNFYSLHRPREFK